MKFRSTKRSAFAAFATTALVAGAMAVPALLAAPAQAAGVEGVAYSCTGAGGPVPTTYTTDVDFTAVWDKATGRAALSAELDDFPNGAPESVEFAGQEQTSTLKVTVDGASSAIDLVGTKTADFKGGTPIDIPTVTGKVGAKGESLSVVLGSFTLVLKNAMTLTCSLPSPAPAAVTVPITFPEGNDLNFLCTYSGNTFAYLTDAAITAKQNGANVDLTVGLESMPNTAPSFINFTNQDVSAIVGTTVGETAKNLTGTHKADFVGGTPVVIPPVTGSVASTANPVSITFSTFEISVGVLATIDCAIHTPTTLTAATTPAGPSAACTAAKAKVAPAQNAVTSATKKVAADNTAVKNANAKVTAANKAVKKAKGKKKKAAKKKLNTAKSNLAKAKSTLSADSKKLATAKSTLTSVNNAVKANC